MLISGLRKQFSLGKYRTDCIQYINLERNYAMCRKAKAAFKLLLDRLPTFKDIYTGSLKDRYNKSNETEYSSFRNISMKLILIIKDEYTSIKIEFRSFKYNQKNREIMILFKLIFLYSEIFLK